MSRLDGLVPNTPRVGSANRLNGASKRKNFETPLSRVKAEIGSSPPTFKTLNKPGDQNGQNIPYGFRYLVRKYANGGIGHLSTTDRMLVKKSKFSTNTLRFQTRQSLHTLNPESSSLPILMLRNSLISRWL